ncbi:MAG: ABC transporter permease [Actinomycetales bacterium]|nr:MAG: ABC transporter permease [Actinomycetales bacterium]
MGHAVAAELRKFFTTRMWWGMAIGVFVAGAGMAALFALLALDSPEFAEAGVSGIDDPAAVRTVYTGGLGVSYLLTLAIGVLAIGTEYRHKTITATFLATPKRSIVMTTKVIALLVIGAFYGLVSLVGAVGVGATVIAAKGGSPFPDGTIWRTLALSLLVLGLWALIGLGAGILIPNQVAALLISIGVAWIVEPILAMIFSVQSWGGDIAKFFPSSATNATLSGLSQTPDAPTLTWWAGALVLAGYAAAMTAVGTALTLRRDVS